MRKTILLITTSLLFTFASFAQGGIGISMGARTGIIKSNSYSEFMDSYNSLYSGSIDKELGSFTPSKGVGLNADLNLFGALFFTTGYSFNRASAKAVFSEGGIQHFRFSQNTFKFCFGYSYENDNLMLALSGGFLSGMTRMRVFYEYSDGSKSYGTDKPLNGIYDWPGLPVVASLQGGYKIKDGIKAYLTIDYLFKNLDDLIRGTDNSPLHDANIRRLDSGAPMEIPTNMQEYASTGTYNINETVQEDFFGLRMEIGLRFYFGDFDK